MAEPALTPTPEAAPLPGLFLSPFLEDPKFLALAAGLVLVLLITLFVLRQRTKSKRVKSVLLVGPSDSGKTALFANLVYQQHLPSHASLQPNIGLLLQETKTVRVIDVPGHPRIRDRFKEHLADVDGIVFTVDATTVARNSAAVAEHLHVLLSALVPLSQQPQLLLLATKADLVQAAVAASDSTTNSGSVARTRVISVLEREVEKRRVSSLSQKTGGAMEGLGAVAGGEKAGIFGSSVPKQEDEDLGVEGVLEAGPNGVWRFGDEWEIGVSWVPAGENSEGLRTLTEWMGQL